MNSKSIISGVFGLLLTSGSAFGQEEKVVESAPAKPEEVKAIKKEIRKEVRMEDNDGVKILTIITDVGGVITEEVFEGEAAEAKLAELTPQMEDVTVEHETVEERIEAEVDDYGNLKSVKIISSRNGEETVEVLEGEAALKKLEEVQMQVETDAKGEKQLIKKEKRKTKRKKKVDQ